MSYDSDEGLDEGLRPNHNLKMIIVLSMALIIVIAFWDFTSNFNPEAAIDGVFGFFSKIINSIIEYLKELFGLWII